MTREPVKKRIIGIDPGYAITGYGIIDKVGSKFEVIDYGVRFIHIVTPFYIAICFNQIYAGALRGIGDATMPTVIMLASFVVFRQIYLAVTKALGAGFLAVALAYPVGWILCSTLLIIRYVHSPLKSNS